MRCGHTARVCLFGMVLVLGPCPGRAATYQVGPTRTYKSVLALPSLAAGDVVEIDSATYNEVKRWTASGSASQPIVIRGAGVTKPVFDATNQIVDGVLPHPRAIFQIEGSYLAIENLEFRNARNGNNGAGIRVSSGNNVTVRQCRITSCDMGVMCDNNSNLLIEGCEVAHNGTPLFDGYSHNFYLGGNNATIRYCYIHDALNGQNFKSRAHYTELLYNYIADSQDGEVGLVDASQTAATNSHAVMIGNIVISKPRLSGYNSGRFVQFGQDSGGQHNGALFAFNNTFIAGDGRIQFLSANAPGAYITAGNNIFFGSGQLVGTFGGGVSGTNNWAQSSAVIPGSFAGTRTGSDPGFVNRSARDVRLTAGSPCRDFGATPLAFVDGNGALQAGIPLFEYVNHLQHRVRPMDDHLDIGAYEFTLPVINSLILSGADCLLTFNAQSGIQYSLELANAPGTGGWLPSVTNIDGHDSSIQVTDRNGAGLSQRYYRLSAVQATW